MRRWRRPSRTRGTWTATTCGAPAGSTRRSRSSPRPTRSRRRTSRRSRFRSSTDWHYQHNLDLLATSYQYVGQMKKAEELFTRSFAIASSLLVQEFNKREWPEFLLARGRAQEALAAAATMAAHRSPVVSAAGHVEAGRARLALGQFKEAADEGNAALRLMRGAEGGGIVATAAAGDAGRVPAAHRQGGAGAADARGRRAARRGRCPGPTPGRRRCSRSRRSRARRARSATGNWPAGRRVRCSSTIRTTPASHEALALVAEHHGDAATAARRAGAGGEVLEERGSRREEVGRVLSDRRRRRRR